MHLLLCSVFFFNDTATTEIYTLSLHDALPISVGEQRHDGPGPDALLQHVERGTVAAVQGQDLHAEGAAEVQEGLVRSEEHTSELQSRQYLVCRLLLEKKKIH